MEKKIMDALHAMLCGEIEDIAKKGVLSHETLDILKDLVETEKNLEKIKKYQKEEEMGMDGDMGYSQRKFYIDADYDPYAPRMSYGRGRSMDGNSYGYTMGRVYDGGSMSYADGGNSYGYYDPRYEQMPMYSMGRGMNGGYSGHGDKQSMIKELKEMMSETQDLKIKEAIQKILNEVNK